MFKIFNNDIRYKKERLVRVIVYYKNGTYSSASGFFIDKSNKLLTCFHVIFGLTLREIRESKVLDILRESTEHDKLAAFYSSRIDKLELGFPNGVKIKGTLKDFDEKYDVASVEIDKKDSPVRGFTTDLRFSPDYGDEVFFCGYQYAVDYDPREFPFAVNRGMVSNFPEITIGGEKYQHIQINSINLGGNSGAPLFRGKSNKVVGIINGNMNWGSDDIAYLDKKDQPIRMKGGLKTPLSIAYATPLKLIKSKTNILS